MTHCDVCHPDVNAITEPVDHRGPAHDAVAGLKPETRRWMRQWLSDNPAACADHATPDTDGRRMPGMTEEVRAAADLARAQRDQRLADDAAIDARETP